MLARPAELGRAARSIWVSSKSDRAASSVPPAIDPDGLASASKFALSIHHRRAAPGEKNGYYAGGMCPGPKYNETQDRSPSNPLFFHFFRLPHLLQTSSSITVCIVQPVFSRNGKNRVDPVCRRIRELARDAFALLAAALPADPAHAFRFQKRTARGSRLLPSFLSRWKVVRGFP